MFRLSWPSRWWRGILAITALALPAAAGFVFWRASHARQDVAAEIQANAEQVRPAGNEDAILRWNSCQRLIERYHLHANHVTAEAPVLGDD